MRTTLKEIMTGRARLAREAIRGPAPRAGAAAATYLLSRWRGQPGRLEVWYTTLTDPATGTGFWLHHELVAPTGGGEPHAHGWAAIFPPDDAPTLARFGPQPWRAPERDAVFAVGDVIMTPHKLRGSAGSRSGAPGQRGHAGAAPGRSRPAGSAEIEWDLTIDGGGAPLFTFPRWAWEREALPGAQIVPTPAAVLTGTIRHLDHVLTVTGATGASARTYGRGNPKRWAWLHADLGGGDVCEVVAATSMRPGLSRLPPLPFVRLRIGGRDWPHGDPMVHSVRFTAKLGLPTWTVLGVLGDRRIRIQVTQPPERTVTVDYTDPDGSAAVCRNSERADAVITLQRRTARGWQRERLWRLDATAHAEVGARE